MIIEDGYTGQFLIPKRLPEEDEDEYDYIFVLDLHKNKSLAQQLGKFLQGKGLVLSSFTELEREIALSYSFIDKTPGTFRNIVAYHVKVEIIQQQSHRFHFLLAVFWTTHG